MNAGMLWEVHGDYVLATLWDGFQAWAPRLHLWDAELFRNYNSVVLLDQYNTEEWVRPGDIVIDRGAHIGLFAYAATRRGANVIAFEPFPPNIEALKRNLALWGISDRVTVVPKALGHTEGRSRFAPPTGMSGGGRVLDTGTLAIECTRLDRYIEENKVGRISLLKLDVEGYERQALRGAVETIRRDRPVIVCAAYHLPGDDTELPALLNEIAPEYDISIGRHRGCIACELEVWAVPRRPE